MIELELIMVVEYEFIFMLCIPWTNYIESLCKLVVLQFTPDPGEAQSDCTNYCECLYIIDAI